MLLNKKQAASYCGVSQETIDRYKTKGKLGFIQIGKRCLWTRELLDEFISNCTIPAVVMPSNREKLEITKRAVGGVA